MGTLAAGNFDNDGAMDHLGKLIQQLVTAVEDVLADAQRLRLDEDGESVLIPSVEILCLLCERYHAAPPRSQTVAKWRKKYLQVFDEQIDDLAPQPDYKTRRRKVIDDTFQWLDSLSQSFWE